MLRSINRAWDSAADQAEFICGLTVVIGLLLIGASYVLDIHSVQFDGSLQDYRLLTNDDGALTTFAPKEVGYLLAPNWGLTGLIFLPLAFLSALRARASIKPLLRSLVDKNMLVSSSFELVSKDLVVEQWEKESSKWTAIGIVMFIFSFVLVMIVDFVPVVANWLLSSPQEIKEMAKSMTLQHDTFEFDWSVAATFKDPVIDPVPNLAFGFFAYIVIAAIGSGFLFASFISFIALCAFFSPTKLESRGLILLPKVDSDDPRLGFESFENFFEHLVQASIFTATIAVSMHLQNVYLRAPKYEDIIEMVFGDTIDKMRAAISDFDLTAIINNLTSTSQALGVPLKEMTLQSFASSLALFMICAVVFICVWVWLRVAALDGQKRLRDLDTLSKDQKRRLDQMNIWPVGWISLNSLIIIAILVGLSMWYVNFVSVVIIYFIIRALLGFGWAFMQRFV